jgi:hypothetical protein
MATTNITLELRQADARKVNNNGDYETVLARQITINDGDIVQLKSCFLDTVNSDNINIPDDLTLTLVNGVYINDWYYSDLFKNNWVEEDGGTPAGNTVSPGGRRFIPYKTIVGSADYVHVQYCVYNLSLDTPNEEDNFPTMYSYIDLNGNTQYLNGDLTWYARTGENMPQNPQFQAWDPINVIAKAGSIKVVTPDASKINFYSMSLGGFATNPITLDNIYQPWEFTTNFTLPKGSYTATELATTISKSLSVNTVPDVGRMTGSNFLFQSKQFDATAPNPDGSNGTIPIQTPVISTIYQPDGSLGSALKFNFVADKTMFLGSNQMALEFDSGSNKFNWSYLHMPMYDSTTGTNMCVRYLTNTLSSAGYPLAITEGAGVYFTSMSATDSKGKFVDFWGGILGFNVSAMCVNYKQPITGMFGDTTGKYFLLDELVPGVNITTGYMGLDSGVVKGVNTWYVGQPIPNTQAGICSTISDTVNITAVQTYNQLSDRFSHYLLQLDINFYNTFVGVDNYRTLNAIVNKYYNYGSYTFGDPDSALTYVHKGAPLYLKSIKTRILTPNKQLDPSLGTDNTVYLSVIKPLQSMPVQ